MFASIVLLPSSSHSSAHSRTAYYDWTVWGEAVDTLRSVKAHEGISLGSPFILANSESVYVDSLLLDKSAYEINYQRGFLRIKTLIGENSVVRVSYVRLPLLLRDVYSLRKIAFAESPRDIGELPPKPAPRPSPEKPSTNLYFGGTKSVSFAFGSNRGASLDQTLKATIEGNLTSTIQVRALLSDNNLPIQPEGNTEELEQLDKVLIEVSSERAKATLGDITLANRISKFSSFTRELKGASAEASAGSSRFTIAGGSSKGVFRTVQFRGTERLQGPYELLSPGRLYGEVILAGTERVYLDGEPLQRGKNRDYTIDYDRGTITFTPKRLITSDSEIAVDFEVSQEQFDRTSVFGGVETRQLPAGLVFRTLFARERDDPGRPKSISLGAEERRILAGAGDDPAHALMSGITEVAPGQGGYILVPEDSVLGVPAHFEFNDSSGTFKLSFIEAGMGKGDYILGGFTKSGTPIYEFAGLGKGNYKVGRQLPLPESRAVFTARLLREKGDHVLFDLEYNVSDHDMNLLSDIGDADNVGDAGELRFHLKNLPVRIGELRFEGSVSTLHERFRSLDKTRGWYFYRDWNLENVPLAGRELLGEVRTTFARGEGIELGYRLGGIDRENFSGMKHEGTFLFSREADQKLKGRVFSTEVDGSSERRKRQHGTASVSCGLWAVVPSVTYGSERYRVMKQAASDSGIAYDLVKLQLSKRRPKNVSFSIGYEERDTEEIFEEGRGWEDSRRNRTISGSIASKLGTSVRGELELIHRIEDNFRFDDKRTSDLARIKGSGHIERIHLRSDVDYEISQSQTRTLQKTVVFVGEGKGDYNAQGEPVGKGKGDYTLIFVPTTSMLPTRAVDFTLRLVWNHGYRAKPGRGGGGVWDWITSNISLDQTFSVKEETTYDPAWKVYLLFPSALQRDAATLHGITSLRQDWSLLNGYRNISLVFRYEREDEEDNRFQDVREDRFLEQQSVRLDRSISPRLTLGSEVKREIRRRKGAGLPEGTGSVYEVTGWSFLGGMGLRFSAGSAVDVDLQAGIEEDSRSKAEQKTLSLKPRLVWRITTSVSLFGRYELTRFWERSETGIKPIFFTAEGNAHRWSLTQNVRLSKMITLVSTYQGRSEITFLGKRIVDHDFRIETRAYF